MKRNDAKETLAAFEKLHRLYEGMKRPIQILVVEDDDQDVEMIKVDMRGYRVELTVVKDAESAIEKLSHRTYDLCLLDLALTGRSGLDVIRESKKMGNMTPMFVLTGLTDDSPAIKESLTLGAECVIQKPLTPENIQMIFGSVR